MRVGDALAGRHIVVTGVTGFLGKVWLAHLLHHVPGIGRVTVVVRPRSRRVSARERFEAIVDTSPVFRPLRARPELEAWLGDRLVVIAGDVERPLLGMPLARVDALGGAVDAVVHCAGLTDFQPDPLRALSVNVGGAKHAADLARRLGAPLLHVSTAFVAGRADGRVPESLTPGIAPSGVAFDVAAEVRAAQLACGAAPDKEARVAAVADAVRRLGWTNIYTWSKGLAEHLVAGRDDVQATLVRPSIVECARDWPLPGWNEGLNTAGPLAWLISTGFRRLPTRPGNTFDIVPVDDVARAMTLTLAHLIAGDAPPVVQLASGDVNPLTFGRTVELTGLGLRRWSRRQGGAGWDALYRHLDPVPVAPGAEGVLTVPRLRAAVGAVREGLRGFDPRRWLPPAVDERFGDALAARVRQVKVAVGDAHASLSGVEQMLELYRPFIHDHDYHFCTEGIRSMSAALPDGSPFAWAVPDIDWRHYWVDVEYPGLSTWSIPLIRGEKVPSDPASDPPFRLRSPAVAHRAASK